MNALELNSSAEQPITQGDWLLTSVGWVLACLIGWLLASHLLSYALRDTGTLLQGLLFGTAAVAHLLIWHKALLGTWATTETQPKALWLDVVSACWTFGLVLFQLACIGLWFTALILALDHRGLANWG